MTRITPFLLLLALLLAACGGGASPASEPIDLAQGRALYDANCASCHGVNGEGQPNWQQPLENGVWLAPPHDASGHTWHHPDAVLLQIINDGGSAPNSTMPAYADILTREQQRAVLEYIKSFWPDDIRAAQADLSRRYEEAQP